MPALTLETVRPDNLETCGIGCLVNSKNPGYRAKAAWLRDRFAEGLRFLLFRDDRGKPLAFLEYVPGKFACRPVDADGWLLVHCLWVYPPGQRIGGLGGRLIEACLDRARESRARGVAALVSDGPWMAGKQIFLKHGFEVVAAVDRFQLIAHRQRRGHLPRVRDITHRLKDYRGLHVVYAPQCPMLHKSVTDLSQMAGEYGLTLQVTELHSAREAQEAPSYYGVYSLIWNGRLLSDHYVSKGRFRNILKNDILKEAR